MARRERVTMTGLLEAQERVNRVLRFIGKATRVQLIEFGLAVLGTAVRNAPVDKGDMRAAMTLEVNGRVWAEGQSDGGIRVLGSGDPGDGPTIIRIGTAGIVYALVQHEVLTFVHPKGGGPKFLENALNEHLPTLLSKISAFVNAELEGGAAT
jgi:hypothetical protein